MKEKRLIHLHSAERPEPVEGEQADRSSLDFSDGAQSEQQAIDPAERRTDQLSKSADNVATPDQLKTGLRQNTVGVDDKGSYVKDGIFHGVIVYDLPGGRYALEVGNGQVPVATTGAQVYAALGGGKNLKAENIAFRNGNETGYAYWDKEGDGGKGCYQVLDTKSGEIRKLVIPNGSHFVFEEGVEPSRIAELKDSINADQLLAVIDSAGELTLEQKAEEAKRIANGEEVAAQAEVKIALEQGAKEKPFGTEEGMIAEALKALDEAQPRPLEEQGLIEEDGPLVHREGTVELGKPEFIQPEKPTPKPAPAKPADGFVRLDDNQLAAQKSRGVNLEGKEEVAVGGVSMPTKAPEKVAGITPERFQTLFNAIKKAQHVIGYARENGETANPDYYSQLADAIKELNDGLGLGISYKQYNIYNAGRNLAITYESNGAQRQVLIRPDLTWEKSSIDDDQQVAQLDDLK